MSNSVTSYENILCINSDPILGNIIGCYLKDCGFTVYEASKLEESLRILSLVTPDLVLLDIEMPDLAGFTLLNKILQNLPDVLVVVIVQAGKTDTLIKALELGAWDYIHKPIANLSILEHTVCRVLEHKRLLLENKSGRVELEDKNTLLLNSLKQLQEDERMGRSVQQFLLPLGEISQKGYTVSHKIVPSLFLKGDYTDYFKIDKENIGFYIANVSGSGASAAFVTVMLKGLFEHMHNRFKMNIDEIIMHPDQVLKKISDEILEANIGKQLNIVYGILNLINNSLHYSVGGSSPNPVIWDGKMATFLTGNGFSVGIFKDAKYENYCCQLPAQFSMAIFSEGIYEVIKGKDKKERESNLISVLNESKMNVDGLLDPRTFKNKELAENIIVLLMNKNMYQSSHCVDVNLPGV